MFFTGWRDFTLDPQSNFGPPPLAAARSWLQKIGWRRLGLISLCAAWTA